MQTDAKAESLFTFIGITQEILYIHVKAQGFSTIHWVQPTSHASLTDNTRVYEVSMRPSGTVQALVSDTQKNGLQHHWLTATFLNARPESLQDASKVPLGAQLYEVGISDENGTVMLNDLEPGFWALSSESWKNFDSSEETIVEVKAGETVLASVMPPAIEPETYASGTIKLPDDSVVSRFDTINRYRIESTAGLLQSPWLYGGGKFYVFGSSTAILEVRLVDQDSNQSSKPFAVTVGRHDHRIEPKW